ncbi:MAG TPA: YkgJ family cysteine cluster protein [Methanocella sp.]|nr:YkgJ family cysteine cluster protein [Methanocella sp.]
MLSRQEFFALARGGRFSTEEKYEAYEAYATCPAFRKGSFHCERCGACCRRPWRVEASAGDIRRWISEKRLDIVENLVYWPKRGRPRGPAPGDARALRTACDGESLEAMLAFALAASREGALVIAKDAGGCVYHDGSGCAIHGTRPGVCARFPDARLFKGLAALVQQR